HMSANKRKLNLIEKAARVIMRNPIKFADVIICALEWHLDNAFSEDELRETFFAEDDLGGLHNDLR
ncbi:hypothetical protein LRR18_18035, partial [Mangrovimonas sp. AS39]|uniref:hypothetical protein n=1 Tax=Mangrovimonas futianensis TaxID=2895523 RepID=UPI001E43A839